MPTDLVVRHHAVVRWVLGIVTIVLVGVALADFDPDTRVGAAFVSVCCVAFLVETLVFRLVADDAGIQIRSLFGRRSWAWDEVTGVLMVRDGLDRMVADPQRLPEQLVLHGAGRQRALMRMLQGFEALVAELRRRDLMSQERPPDRWTDRVHGAGQRFVASLHTTFGLTVLLLVCLGVAAWAVQGPAKLAPTGANEVDLPLATGAIYVLCLLVSAGLSVVVGRNLLRPPGDWGFATAGVLFSVAMLLAGIQMAFVPGDVTDALAFLAVGAVGCSVALAVFVRSR